MSQTTNSKLKLAEIGRTNASIHSDAECKVIKAALRGAERALLCLPASAATLRKKLADEIGRYEIALAPHKKLPADIWLQIFDLCYCIESGCPLMVLQQVCSGWRMLLMRSPAFWSNVSARSYPHAFSCARTWLLPRAASIPRSLVILEGVYSRTSSLKAVKELEPLFPFLALDIWMSEGQTTRSTAQKTIESFLPPELTFSGEMSFPPAKSTSLFSHSLPNLTCMIMGDPVGQPVFYDLRHFSKWSGLRKLGLRCRLPKFHCLAILRDTPSVEECSMFVDSDSGKRPTVKDIVVPNLTSLELHFRSESDAASFLDALTLPELSSLQLRNRGCNESTLHRLAKRSGMQKMETLVISQTTKPLNIGPLLRLLPSLHHLEVLTSISLGSHTMHQIGRGEIVPRLRVLHLRGKQLNPLIRMTELRRYANLSQPWNLSLLEKVSIEGYPYALTEDQKWRVRFLRYRGIIFDVQKL